MAIIFHICAFASIFDIYFRSPIINGLESVNFSVAPEASRVVIFIGDGGRADSFFQVHEG